MSKPTLLLARELPELFMQALQQLGEPRVANSSSEAAAFAGGRVYIGTAMDPVDAALIERFPDSLGLVANLGVGTDNIDFEALARRGIAVSNTPVVTEDTADLTMALMLAACRQLSFCERALRRGEWDLGQQHLGSRVQGKTLGIIGLGDIGQAVARRARGFDMQLLYHGPTRKSEAEQQLGVQYRAALADLLAESDIVSLNCPLTPATRHLINATSLAKMKTGAVLINTGRGPLIDEDALVEALAEGQLGAAGLDVFEFEPHIHPLLLDFDNVTLTPHLGSATRECRTDIAMRAFANVRHFLEHGAPLDSCN